LGIQTDHTILVFRCVRFPAVASQVHAAAKRLDVGVFGDGGGEKDAVSPDDRGRVPGAGDGRLPLHAFILNEMPRPSPRQPGQFSAKALLKLARITQISTMCHVAFSFLANRRFLHDFIATTPARYASA